MKHSLYALLLVIVGFTPSIHAQSLLDELEAETKNQKTKEYAFATFKGARIINGHSIEMPAKGELMFMISHRFGRVNTGFYEMFGWDQASIRIGLEYTMPFYDRLCVGIGRSSYNKTWDGFIKYKLFKQAKHGSPVSVSLFADMAINGLRWADPTRPNYFSSRLSFAYQIMIARKFGSRFSLQLTPTVIHKNLVPEKANQNTFFALGAGGRVKVSNRIAITAEYFWLIPGQDIPRINNVSPYGALSVGIDVETGGHIFQFHFTNAQAMFDQAFIGETTGDWLNGDIHFGFNISRTFSFHKKNKKPKKGVTELAPEPKTNE